MALSSTPSLIQINTAITYSGQPLTACIAKVGKTGVWTKQSDFALWADTEAPSQPLNLLVPNRSSTILVLDWDNSTDNIGVTDYKVYKSDVFYRYVGSSISSVTLIGLERATAYEFKVSAIDNAGNESVLSDPTILAATYNETLHLSTTGSSTSSGACSLSSYQTLYHGGAGLYPIVGDTIYESASIYALSDAWNGQDLWWKDVEANKAYEVDDKGVVQTIVNC